MKRLVRFGRWCLLRVVSWVGLVLLKRNTSPLKIRCLDNGVRVSVVLCLLGLITILVK